MTEELSDKCWRNNQRDGIFLPNNQDKKVKRRRKRVCNAALMRSTDEEINCKLIKDVIESQREQKEKQF